LYALWFEDRRLPGNRIGDHAEGAAFYFIYRLLGKARLEIENREWAKARTLWVSRYGQTVALIKIVPTGTPALKNQIVNAGWIVAAAVPKALCNPLDRYTPAEGNEELTAADLAERNAPAARSLATEKT